MVRCEALWVADAHSGRWHRVFTRPPRRNGFTSEDDLRTRPLTWLVSFYRTQLS